MNAVVEAVALKDEELEIVAGGDGLLDTLVRGGEAVGGFFSSIFARAPQRVRAPGEPLRGIIRPV